MESPRPTPDAPPQPDIASGLRDRLEDKSVPHRSVADELRSLMAERADRSPRRSRLRSRA